MGESTTTLTRLSKIEPKSETHLRAILARAHRILKRPGDEAAARAHECSIYEIRTGGEAGTSRAPRNCPRCLARGRKYWLIWVAGRDRCGTCRWPDAG